MKPAELTDQSQELNQITDIALLEAAGMISTLCPQEVQVSAVSAQVTTIKQLPSLLDKSSLDWVAISQRLNGFVEGHAIYFISDENSRSLVRGILEEATRLRELSEMEEEALSEVGNIIINSCLSSYSQILKGVIGTQLPLLSRGHTDQLLAVFCDEEKASELFVIELNVCIKRQNLECYLLWTRLPWLGPV